MRPRFLFLTPSMPLVRRGTARAIMAVGFIKDWYRFVVESRMLLGRIDGSQSPVSPLR
jgi:hypothetical protein